MKLKAFFVVEKFQVDLRFNFPVSEDCLKVATLPGIFKNVIR